MLPKLLSLPNAQESLVDFRVASCLGVLLASFVSTALWALSGNVSLIPGAVGGLSGDAFGLRSPFMIGLGLMISATFYSLLVLPYVKPVGVAKSEKSSTKGLVALMGPTRMLLPQKWRLPDGRVQKHWGVPLLALGVYLGVVRTDLLFKIDLRTNPGVTSSQQAIWPL